MSIVNENLILENLLDVNMNNYMHTIAGRQIDLSESDAESRNRNWKESTRNISTYNTSTKISFNTTAYPQSSGPEPSLVLTYPQLPQEFPQREDVNCDQGFSSIGLGCLSRGRLLNIQQRC